MSRFSGVWYVVIGLLIVTPIGLRALTRSAPRKHALTSEMVQAGQVLFEHDWTPGDPLSGGDGLGPVFNATSCVACHHQGGTGGAGGLPFNVTAFVIQSPGGQARQGVVHSKATNSAYQEKLSHVHAELPNIGQVSLDKLVALGNKTGPVLTMPAGVQVSQRNTPALFGARLIDEIPDRVIVAEEKAQRLKFGMGKGGGEQLPIGRAMRMTDGTIGHFGWKSQAPSLTAFVRAACANELGLGNSGQAQPTPLGVPSYQTVGLDLTDKQCDQLTTFIASLGRPVERQPADPLSADHSRTGKKLFSQVGCADCHTPKLGNVDGIYSDLLVHNMGAPLQGGGAYYNPTPREPEDPSKGGEGPLASEWRTPPLWGVADSAPYLHDGRAATLEEAISMHGGQASSSVRHFNALPAGDQARLIAFLKSLRAP